MGKVENTENKLAGYTGRCIDFTGEIVRKMLSFGRGEVALNPETGNRELWEMQLPVPRSMDLETLEYDCLDLYNLTVAQFVMMGVELLSTRIDDVFKRELFGYVPAEKDSEGKVITEAHFTRACYEPTEADHLAAQAVADTWRYKVRAVKEVGTPLDEIKRQMIAAGAVTEEDVADCSTDKEVFAVMKAKLAGM